MSLSLLLASCVLPNDNGDEAFAASAVEAVLGRKPLGSSEIRALADFAAANGREAMLDVLFEQPEYAAYWANVLADALQVQRAGRLAVEPACIGRPVVPAQWSVQLAQHLAEADPQDVFCVEKPIPVTASPPLGASMVAALGGAEEAYADTPMNKIALSETISPVDPTLLDEKPMAPLYGPDSPFGEFPPINPFLLPHLPRITFDDWIQQSDPPKPREWPNFDDLLAESCYAFNLTDALQAAVRADRLDGVFRAYVPVLATFSGASHDAPATFLGGLLDRQADCMGCHTSTYSTTNPLPRNGNWDRFFPFLTATAAAVDLEGSLFSAVLPTGEIRYGGGGGLPVLDSVASVIGPENHVANAGIRPFGMTAACVTSPDRGYDGFALLTSSTVDPAFAGLGPGAGVLSLIDAYRDSIQNPAQATLAAPNWAAHRTAMGASASPADPGCASCHPRNPLAPDLSVVTPTMTDAQLFRIIRYGRGRMPSVAGDDRAGWDAVQWVRAQYAYSPSLELVERERALVALVAARLVNGVVDEVMGEDLVMPHGFPRNADQAQVLFRLTGSLLDGHSLRAVLKQIVLSEWFSRKPPEDPSWTGYALPLVLLPEVALHPRTTPTVESVGGTEGDLVHRHSTAGRLSQVSAALGWPAPLPGGHPTGVYPDQELMTELGRYTGPEEVEHPDVTVPDLASWIEAFGSCEKPSAVYARDVHTLPTFPPDEVIREADWEDWVDRVVADMQAQGFGWRELAERIQDRLLADPVLTAASETGIANLWAVDLGTSPAPGTPAADIEERAREYCGVLLATPQFMLRGVRPAGPTVDIDNTCLPGEPCTAGDRLAAFEATWKAITP